MTRCIHCTRCIRFATEVAGVPELGAIGRGEDMQITTYLEKTMESEMSANVIDLCPVGALTSKPYVFEARPWELKKTETIDVMDAIGSNIRVDTYGWEVKRILPRVNENINEEWISDKSRYACDGLKNQRLDRPYIKKNGKIVKSSWNEAFELIKNKIKITSSNEVAGFIGDLTNMETTYAIKEFFEKNFKSENLECRSSNFFLDISDKKNYLFNSEINGIEESDLIILNGTNPRYEATILNSRIRKSYLKNKTKIFSFGDVGDLTYPYEILDNNSENYDKFLNKKGDLYEIFSNSKKPMIIFGESFLKLKSASYLFNKTKKFIEEFNKNDDWEILNLISKNASAVGCYDLGVLKTNNGYNSTLLNLYENKFNLVFLFGQDNIKFKKTNEFVIYVGTHGDHGAEIADVILPSAAYTEQDGYYTNLEGKIQKAFKANYPPGEAKEDWIIINELSKILNNKELFLNREYLNDSMMNYLKISKKKTSLKDETGFFVKENIFTDYVDYYYTNVVARSSRTMSECRNARTNLDKTGTEG